MDKAEVEKVKTTLIEIQKEMANDFNVPGAMGILFGVIKDFNRLEKNGFSDEYIYAVNDISLFIKNATGLIHDYPEEILRQINIARKHLSGTSDSNDAEIESLLVERKEARATKNWAKSDEIRNRLNELGVIVKDNPDGTYSWSYK
jgi:cysteinyl-tRNA synthetase